MTWHREAIGGKWEKLGRLQFEFLKNRGLKPRHKLLDIGCGSFRGGVKFIPYLREGNYYGIEKEPKLIEAAREEAVRLGKDYHLHQIADFDLTPLGPVLFDFMLAQSVFTHLTLAQIELCLTRVMPSLSPSGAFYATFLECGNQPRKTAFRPHRWRTDELGTAEYRLRDFQAIAKRLGIQVNYIGRWGHHVSRMLEFERRGDGVKTGSRRRPRAAASRNTDSTRDRPISEAG